MSRIRDDQVDEAIAQSATAWFVRHRESDLSATEQREFMEWLRASPQHVEAYLHLAGMAAKLPEALRGLDVDTELLAQRVRQSGIDAQRALFAREAVPARQPYSQRRGRWIGVAAAVLLALVAGVFWIVRDNSWLSAPMLVVAEGQQRIVTLDDGTVAHLNSNTRMRVRYSRTQRIIELPEGQALFRVTHDARRPFIVRSGGIDAVAVGTQFDVLRHAEQTQITVVEGRVAVLGPRQDERSQRRGNFRAPPAEKSGEAAFGSAEILLGAGDQLKIEDTHHPARPLRVDAQLATAWSRHEVSFKGARLQDVAAQFGRNTGARIEIDDARLRDYRISGVFQAYDVDSFVAYLAQFDGIEIERDGDTIRVRQGAVTEDSPRKR